MSKKNILISLIVTLLLGSIITFYSGNMLASDLSNMFYGVHDIYIVSSLPMFFVVLCFISLIIFFIRYHRYKEYKKSLIKLYSTLGTIFGALGVVFTILTAIVYDNFFTPYPFIGYCVIMLLVNLLIIAICVFMKLKVVKVLPEDEKKRKMKITYIIYTTILSILLFLALYRFGSFLWMPVYVQLRTLNLTWSFYLWALIPMAFVGHIILHFFDGYKNYNAPIIYNCIVLGLSIILSAIVIVTGYTNQLFISAISPALPLERLATKPIDVVFVSIIIAIIAIYYLVYSIRDKKQHINKEG